MLLLVLSCSALIHFIAISSYAAKLSGGLLGKIATSISLMNILLIASRAASALAIPILNKHTELSLDLPFEESGQVMRYYLLAAAAGGISALVLFGNLRSYFISVITDGGRNLIHSLIINLGSLLRRTKKREDNTANSKVHKKVFIANMVGNAIWVAAPLSAILAGVLVPEYRSTAIHLSAVVNGIATIILFSYCDPYFAKRLDVAKETEESALMAEKTINDAALSHFLGIGLAQVLLVPCAYIIAFSAEWL